MNNKHLKRIVRQCPQEIPQNLNKAFIVSSVGHKHSGTSIDSLFSYHISSSDLEEGSHNNILDRIESNISSLIPTYENTSIMDELKSSVKMPLFSSKQRLNELPEMQDQPPKPVSIKERLNFDIERTHYLQRLSSSQVQTNLF